MSPSRVGRIGKALALVAVVAASGGCAAKVKEIHHHSAQARLEGLLAQVLPHTKYPDQHYWVRVSEDLEHPIGLAVMYQRHIYLSALLVSEADETILLALVAHGVAHHRLHHHGKRSVLQVLQTIAFRVGGFFVPGLGYGKHVTDPLGDVALSAGQEPSADEQTITYLTRMGYSTQDWLRALEFLQEHGYAERVGRITTRDREFINRIARLRGKD